MQEGTFTTAKEAIMTMPIDLVLVRHGQSESNVANRAARKGDESLFTLEHVDRHSRTFRLTDEGIVQAKRVGAWLREQGLTPADKHFVSAYTRAKETAFHMGIPNARWYVDYLLRERDYGDMDVMKPSDKSERYAQSMKMRERDPFYWIPPNGESFATLCMRVDRFIQTLHRECTDKRVLVVSHGETMWAMRMRLERLTEAQWHAQHVARDPAFRIGNCQVLHYSRRNPETGEVLPFLGWVRSVNMERDPSDQSWRQINRMVFSNEDLLADVEHHPRFIAG